MPLTVSNDVPCSDIQLGTSDDDKVCLFGFCYSWTSINTENILVHQCIITYHTHMVETYNQLYDHGIFEPIKLACDVDDKYYKTE